MIELINLKAILIIALIFIPLERLLPRSRDQKIFRAHWLNDLVYLFVNGIVIKLGLLVLIGGALALAGTAMPASIPAAIQAQPVWLQAIETIVVADIGFYLAHRAFHTFPVLWKFHSIHHSIQELDWLAAHRVHPVDQILTMAVSLIPVYALGFSGAAVAIYGLVYQGQSLLIHANTRISFGPLKWILASPQFHHWHHANEREAYDKNFAGQLSIIDAIAGTLRVPERMPVRYGVDDPVPHLYHQQFAYPFASMAARLPPTYWMPDPTGEPDK